MNENLAYQDPVWEELIDGKVVLMSPRPTVNHNFVASNIYSIFNRYLKGKGCTPFADGTDLYLTEKDRFVPDGMIVCDRDKIQTDGVHGAPDLVVEVLSPSTAKNDIGHKKDVYEACGVKEYWIVTPIGKMVEVYYNQDGRFEIDAVYTDFSDHDLERMDDDDRKNVRMEIPVSLYDDFFVKVKDIFVNVDGFQER